MALFTGRDAGIRSDGVRFHHPLAFWLGCLAVAVGVCLHLPMYVRAAPMHYRMVGMGLIIGGVLLSAWGLLPRLSQIRRTTRVGEDLHWRVADGVPLSREHWKLVAALVAVLTIDVMKPASIAFVMPGVANEYGIGMSVAGYLALSALVGTAVGSLVWGRLADVFGRRAASLLMAQSALLAIPGIAVVVWLYQRWSSFKSLVLFVLLVVLALFAFAVIEVAGVRAQAAMIAATALLLIAISGVIAMMIPYAAEIYPVHLRGTGSGLIAAGSKAGGILGATLGVAGLFDSFALLAVVIAIPMAVSGVMLWRGGIETSGYELESIQQRFQNS